ncbi:MULTISPECIES: hypothetical protein [unclassified Pseudodesulfovibrio]|uniref:hypothetical protein n=1 Tax=unclassified Pseudodesulfovibrio TaxID=2661612 RepID=UPI0019D486F2|nr:MULTISPECIES: hypothetical protein [unclassified Pseudodesulfovibrio]MCJ2163684.1 hypothetical protein [Pseudodesulfovibrio sp. S3-i]
MALPRFTSWGRNLRPRKAFVARAKLPAIFDLSDKYDILSDLALGVPAQKVVIESLPSDGSIKYWSGGDGEYHVPKWSMDELLVGRFPKIYVLNHI